MRIQIAAPLIYIHKLRPGPRLRYGLGGCQKSMRRRNDDIATLDTGGEERKAQRIRPTGDANAVRYATKCSEVSLELFDHRSATESAILQGRSEDMQQLFLEFLV